MFYFISKTSMENQYTQKRSISYEELQKKCILLAEKIEKSGFKPNMIVSITR